MTDSVEKLLAGIARTHFPTLEERGFKRLDPKNNDSLDFLEVSVSQIRAALEEAYICGHADARDQEE